MKPTTEIKPGVLDNASEFTDPFYSRFTLRKAPKPLLMPGDIEKDYWFPTLYGEVTCAQGIFFCDYDKAAEMMMHPRIKPVRMPKGRALVAFSCYEYKQVLGVAPYNEIAMTIPIMVDAPVNVPLLPMILDIFPWFGYYVFSMPVTSLENQLRGLRIWGLPKVVHEIEVTDDGDDCVTIDHEESGEPYFELRVPKSGEPTKFDVRSNLYSSLDGELKQSETCFAATFNVNKHMNMLFKSGIEPDREYLKIHDTPSGRVLLNLGIDPHPFQFRYAKPMAACFDLPNPKYQSPKWFKA
jgi:hypothetical protein